MSLQHLDTQYGVVGLVCVVLDGATPSTTTMYYSAPEHQQSFECGVRLS